MPATEEARVSGSVAPSPARKPLRIAQISPLYERVPPKLYGGTERVVHYLTEELVRRGHDVTLFASGDSLSSARLEPGYPTALRLIGADRCGIELHLPMLSKAFERAAQFDVIHSHLEFWGFALARLVRTPALTTLHGRLDLELLKPIFEYYADLPVVSISNAQREPLPAINWVGTVYHGLPRGLMTFRPGPGKYLAFLGRIAPEKRPDLAIEIALRAGLPLKIAAKVDRVDREYFETAVKPLLVSRDIEFIGEISDYEKNDFLGNAIALVFPVDWPEPFGLVMIEALACGTPVLARPCGSVPEILRDGVTGFVRASVDELVSAAKRVGELSRRRCREEFEERFTVEIMAAKYECIYQQLLSSSGAATWSRRAAA